LLKPSFSRKRSLMILKRFLKVLNLKSIKLEYAILRKITHFHEILFILRILIYKFRFFKKNKAINFIFEILSLKEQQLFKGFAILGTLG
ncbi:hypothetical protein BpHYR1_023922, partial [Brachionus plicatilis]